MNWPFWMELLVRSSVILLAGEAVRMLTRGQSAAVRHRLLLWTLLCLALLPLLSVVLPDISLPAWSQQGRGAAAGIVTVEISKPVLRANSSLKLHLPLLIWSIGVVISLLPLIIGAVSARKLSRSASRFESGLQSQIVPVFLSGELSTPLTCGFWNPRILLPLDAKEWSPARLQAVLLHESAHVRRRDVAAQMTAHLIASLWWFHPLVWILRRNLRTESELACDAEALQSGFRASEYAAELVALAQTLGRNLHLSGYAISMARRSGLEHRIRAILKPNVLVASRTMMFGFLAAIAAIAVAASAVTVHSDSSFTEQGGSTMKRTLISGLLTSVGLSAAAITGSIHDPAGAAIANAAVIFTNPDTGERQETNTDSEGKFKLAGASAGQYILKAEKPGFVPILREFDLRGESNMDRQLTMMNEGAPPAPADVVMDSGYSTKTLPIGGKVAQSNLLKRVPPVYPAAAKAAGTQGVVQMDAAISKDGVPTELRVVSTPSSDLAESALQAVRQWRYRPTLLNGEPVEVSTTIIVSYTLAP